MINLYIGFFALTAMVGIIFALLAVTTKKLIHSATSLMAVLMIFSAYYLLLGAEFLAGIQILLYVGGVLVLIIFAIMVTASRELEQEPPKKSRKLLAMAASLSFFAAAYAVFTNDFFKNVQYSPKENELESIGQAFLNYGSGGHIISFELISIILLVALIGGIVIGRQDNNPQESK